MKQIVFNNKKYFIPTKWSEITLEQKLKHESLMQEYSDLEEIMLVSSFCAIPERELMVILKDSKEALVYETIKETLRFVTVPYTPQPIAEFTHRGNTYYVDESDMTNAEYVSIATVRENHALDYKTMVTKLIAIRCKRKLEAPEYNVVVKKLLFKKNKTIRTIKEYETLNDYNISERAQEFLDLPITTVLDLQAFFLGKNLVSSLATRLSSDQDLQEKLLLPQLRELKNIMKASQQRVHGGSFITKWQIGIYLFYIKYLIKALEKRSNSAVSKSFMKSWKLILQRLHMKKRDKV